MISISSILPIVFLGDTISVLDSAIKNTSPFLKTTTSSENGSYDISAVLLGAIVGIASTLITLLVSKIVGMLYRREVDNWNGLVKLEHILNTNFTIIHEYVLALDGVLERLKKGVLPVLRFRSCEFDTKVLLEIKNLDLINDIFPLTIDLKRMNHFGETVTSIFDDLRKAKLSKQITQEEFEFAINSVKKDIEDMAKFAKFLEEETQLLSAKVRVLESLKGPIRRILKFFTTVERYPKDFEVKVQTELASVKEDVKKVVEKRKQRMEAFGIKTE